METTYHIDYLNEHDELIKYRRVLLSGKEFRDHYLYKYSTRETEEDFRFRRLITPVPAHARTNLLEIRNSIYYRLFEIQRLGGSKNYQQAVNGRLGGVDLSGSTMTYYLGFTILLELLAFRRVGIYIDNSRDPGATKAATMNMHPYIYHYQAENILDWQHDENNQLVKVVLRDVEQEGTLPVHHTRILELEGDRVKVTIDDKEPTYLELTRIPFVLLQISDSLLKDAADYQISMMNMESCDIGYSIQSNFPFYVEQYNPGAEDFLPKEAKEVGTRTGRRYAANLDAPSFINPSPEPLEISMAKQQRMEETIRKLMQLSLSNVTTSGRASADSKREDNKGQHSGLLYISMELERAERMIAASWSEYEGGRDLADIIYPKTFEDQSTSEALGEAKDLLSFANLPSLAYKKALLKLAITKILGKGVTSDDLESIHKEIDALDHIFIDLEALHDFLEAGTIDHTTVANILGFSSKVVDAAKEEHAARLARIQAAQTSGARGVDPTDPDSAKIEKQQSRNRDNDHSNKKHTRGKGR